MNRFAILLAAALLSLPAFSRTGHSETVPFDSQRWEIKDGNGRVEDYLGRKSLFLRSGLALLKDATLEDGVIEVAIAAPNRLSFLGVVFRLESDGDYEIVYFRAHKSDRPDAVQYTPSFNSSAAWQIYSGEGFTSPAHIRHDDWVHARIVISGLSARVYFDDMEEPVLVVNDLKRGLGGGSLGLWGFVNGGHFSNFSYEPSETENATAGKHGKLAPGILEKWELSEAFDSNVKDIDAVPSPTELKAMTWEPVAVESPGMVVINRYRETSEIVPSFREPKNRTGRREGRKVVFARAVIHSDSAQTKKMSFGYSDEATVILNSKPLFTGKSAFLFRDPGFAGIMDVENDAVYLDLKKGRNEIILAVADYFGGWGFICRIDDMQGIELE